MIVVMHTAIVTAATTTVAPTTTVVDMIALKEVVDLLFPVHTVIPVPVPHLIGGDRGLGHRDAVTIPHVIVKNGLHLRVDPHDETPLIPLAATRWR